MISNHLGVQRRLPGRRRRDRAQADAGAHRRARRQPRRAGLARRRRRRSAGAPRSPCVRSARAAGPRASVSPASTKWQNGPSAAGGRIGTPSEITSTRPALDVRIDGEPELARPHRRGDVGAKGDAADAAAVGLDARRDIDGDLDRRARRSSPRSRPRGDAGDVAPADRCRTARRRRPRRRRARRRQSRACCRRRPRSRTRRWSPGPAPPARAARSRRRRRRRSSRAAPPAARARRRRRAPGAAPPRTRRRRSSRRRRRSARAGPRAPARPPSSRATSSATPRPAFSISSSVGTPKLVAGGAIDRAHLLRRQDVGHRVIGSASGADRQASSEALSTSAISLACARMPISSVPSIITRAFDSVPE